MEPERFNLGKALPELIQFRKERGWEKFHKPKNLSMSLSIEASELMEHFQWREIEEAGDVIKDLKRLEMIRNEIADIQIYLLYLAADLNIDLLNAIRSKMVSNAEKYPKHASRLVI